MKKIILLFAVLFALHEQQVYAQVIDTSAQWTWIAGAKVIQDLGSYGTVKVPSTSNFPAARYNGISWVDKKGAFWFFGGTINPGAGVYYNDLWRYKPSTKEWTFMSGTKYISGNSATYTQKSVYGTQGSPDPANTPGARGVSAHWLDKDGNLWLYGGWGYGQSSSTLGRLGDLWKYDIALEQWTYISGNKNIDASGVYSAPGVTNSTNYPGGRQTAANWTDAAGNLWMFGGSGMGSGTTGGVLNDLWKYNPTSGQWTFVSGSGTIGQNGIYNTPGSNVPGSRDGAIGWIDGSDNLWMFGGTAFGATGSSANRINDLWKFNTTTNEWTWMNGSSTAGSGGSLAVIGTRGVPAAGNTPGGRSNQLGGWVDAQGCFWLFGGYAWGTTVTANPGFLNDLWKYDPLTNMWTFIRGASVALTNGPTAVYGTQNLQAWANTPGGRGQNGIWKDTAGNIWILGGQGYASNTSANALNDFWLLSPPPCFVSILANKPLTICQGDSVILKASKIATGNTYEWYNATTLVGTDTIYAAKAAGSYTVRMAAGTCNAISLPAVVAVNTLPVISILPATAVICNGKDTALTASGGTSYTWLPNTFTGSGATVRATPTTTTTYTVTGTDGNGCKNTATRAVTVNTLPNVTISPATAVICNGKDTALTGGGATTYTWLPNTYTGSGATIRANPTALTTYTVTGTDANGCVNTATRTVTVNALPNITISPATAVICNGKDTALTAGGGAAYSWLPAGSLNTASGANVRANPTTMTTYTVTGMDANGCQNTATRTVTVNANPSVVINPATAAICLGKDTAFTASGASSYSWTPTLGLNAVTGAAVRANPAATTDYIVTGTDANGCIGKDTQRVVVKALPVAVLTPPGPVGFCEFDSILLTANYIAGANNTYQWKLGNTNVGTGGKTYMAKAGGNYTVTVKDTASCSATSSIVIVAMNTHPSAALTISGPLNFCRGGSVTMGITFDTGLSYTWYDAGAAIPFATTSFYQAINSGTYKVIVARNHVANCTDTSQDVPVVVYPLPEPVISGNGANMYTDSTYVSYHWYYMGINILNATTWKYKATKDGSYMVIVVDSNGCTNTSASYTVLRTDINDLEALADEIKVYPNPVSNRLYITSPEKVSVQIINLAGQQVLYQALTNEIDVSALTNGIYITRIIREDGSLIRIEKLTKF